MIAVLVAVVALLAPGVANADHRDRFHWGHGFAPYPSADCAQFGGTWCNYTGNAENTWNANGYPNGFVGGNPYQGCGTPASGWINVCVTNEATVRAAGCPAPAQGCTQHWYVFDPNQHKQRNRVYIWGTGGHAGGGTYYVNELQSLTTHEYGHAIGLGHTTATGSVMRATFTYGSGPVFHDQNALTNEYNHVDP